MGAIATFNYALWIERFPEFGTAGTVNYVSAALAQMYFDEAGDLFLRNDGTGLVWKESTQTYLLYLLTAHLAKLGKMAGTGGGGLVGRITDATEGSVSVTTDKLDKLPAAAAWYAQTPYGFEFWQATAAWRIGFYRPYRGRLVPPGAPFGGGWGG